MDGELFLNSKEISTHKDHILEEKYTAQRLRDNIDSVRRMVPDQLIVDRELVRQFQLLSEKLDMAVRFYSALYSAMDDLYLETDVLSGKIGLLLEDYQEGMSRQHIFNVNI